MAKSLHEVGDRLREQQRERDLCGEHGAPHQPAGRQPYHRVRRLASSACVRHLAQRNYTDIPFSLYFIFFF